MTGLRTSWGRRLAIGGIALSLTSTAAAIAVVRPAAAAPVLAAAPASAAAPAAPAAAGPVGLFGATVTADAITSSGTVDASGGLVLTDAGSATANGLLDGSPSARTSAVTAEPGTTVRTLSASEGGPLPPGAAAQYPGGPATSNDTTVGVTNAAAGELAGSASASADPSGSNTAATASLSLTRDAAEQNITATGTANSGSVTVGPLVIGSVTGNASVSYDGAGHHATAGTVVTSASVAGTAVTIDDTGVHAAGAPATGGLPATPVNSVLAAAGISVTVLAPVMTTTERNALADSGALVIHESTPDATSGTTTVSSAQNVTLYLGQVTATLSDQLPVAAPPVTATVATPSASATAAQPTAVASPSQGAAAGIPPVAGKPAVPGRTVTTVIPGTPAIPAAPVQAAAPPAAVAAAPQAADQAATTEVAAAPSLRLLNYRLDSSSALAGFGVWQLLTLGIATTGAMIARRRTEPEEEHLCPCP